MGTYTLLTGNDGQYYFNLKAGNNEIILQSEGYKQIQGAINGIESVQQNSSNNANYEKRTSKIGEPYFVLKAGNGQVIGTSEMYSTHQALDNGIRAVQANGKVKGIDSKPETPITILINNKPYKATSQIMNGEQILELANLNSARYNLYQEGQGKHDQVSPAQYVVLKNGLKFQAIVKDIKFG